MKQPLFKRASETVASKAPSGELQAIQFQILARLTQVEQELNTARHQIDTAGNDGDINSLRAARQGVEDLADEELVLRRQSTELYHARKAALGAEAVAAQGQFEAAVAKTLEQELKAQTMLDDCRNQAKQVIAARRAATETGADLRFDRETIKALSAVLYTGNEAKQSMIDLGAARLREARCI